MSYVYTPSQTTIHHTIVNPDSGDTGAAGAIAAATALEGGQDNGYFAAIRVGNQYVGGADYGVLGTSAVAAYGTGDYAFFTGIQDVAVDDYVVVHAHWHGSSTGAAAAEFELGYAIGLGAKTDLLMSRVVFDSLAGDTLPVSTIGWFKAAAAGDLKLYIRQVSPGGVQTVMSEGPWAFTVKICKKMDT